MELPTYVSYFLLAVIIYTYLGYPVVIGVVGKIYSVPVKKNENYFPTITLLITAYNEEDVIEDKLENVIQIEYPAENLKIIVVSDGSDDEKQIQLFRGMPIG
jgi:poly-beta-1,6-N-acetyl-D-glucosamine synthase